jgi:hypothetical protein
MAVSPEGKGRQSGNLGNNTNSLMDVPQLGSRLEEGQAYRFKFMVGYNTAANATGIGLAIGGPAGAVARYAAVIFQTASTFLTGVGSAWDQIIQGTVSLGATPMWAFIEGTVFCPIGVSGDMILRFKSEINGSNVNILDGSYIEIEPLPII